MILLFALIQGCTPLPEDGVPPAEYEAREIFDATPIVLAGQVVDRDGPVEGAAVEAGEASTVTGADGAFSLEVPRRNVMIRVEATGRRPHLQPVWLFRPLDVTEVVLDPVRLHVAEPGEVRFLFGGDVAFGRRYLDTDSPDVVTSFPGFDPEAIIQLHDPLPGTRAVLEEIRPWYQAADVGVANLETVVTEHPDTPHLEKDFVFFTLPGSLPALEWLGVDYVSLGNNHLYDYLEPGVADTLEHVDGRFAWSGGGRDDEEAWAPARLEHGGHTFSMISASSVSGDQFSIGYQAAEDRGGSADLRNEPAVRAAIGEALDAGHVPIAMWHTGKEYSHAPSDYSRGRMHLGVDAGAALVIAHHPHMAQGFEVRDGVLIAHSIGNLALDQQRLETMLGLLVQVDMDGARWVNAEAMPIFLEQYLSRPVTGEMADGLLRRVAEFSDPSVTVVPYNTRVHVGDAATPEDRTVPLTVEVGPEGVAVVDLRPLQREGESIARVDGDVSFRPGRDILTHGTFEDLDVDRDRMEASYWDVSSSSRFPCHIGARRGAVGLCLTRTSRQITDSVVAFRNRIRVWGDGVDEPNKELTVLGWSSGDNAGRVEVVARYYASFGDAEFGEEVVFAHDEGTWRWTPFSFDLHMPPDVLPASRERNPRAVRLFLRHSPPDEGLAIAKFDDLALVGWEETVAAGDELKTPHARDFLRVEAAPGSHELVLVFRRYRPF